MIQRQTHSESQTMALAESFAACLRPGDIVALTGPLGAGKTCFVRGIAQGLGVDPRRIASPTFVLCREHETADGCTLVHVDLYRMRSEQELATIGWDELLEQDDTIIAVEWADRMAHALPAGRTINIAIEHIGETSRGFEISFPAHMTERFTPIRPRTRPCRICGKAVSFDAETFPFCSERCRLVDLGRWFDEKYRISRPVDTTEPGD